MKAETKYYRAVPQLEWPYDVREKAFEDNTKVTWVSPLKKVESNLHPDFPTDGNGLSELWMYMLRNANKEALMGRMEAHNEPVLAHLRELSIVLYPGNASSTLNFIFYGDPYFTNQASTKE